MLVLLLTFLGFGSTIPTPDLGLGPAYALDDLERQVDPKSGVKCPKVELTQYRGDTVRYATSVRVYVGFRQRLDRFEQVVRDVALETYGRAPQRIEHLGTFNCRKMRTWDNYLSEHGLGNAIDVSGFTFAPLSRKLTKQSSLPRPLQRRFTVKIAPHWSAQDAIGAIHQQFLHTLATRLAARDDIFRVMLGPSHAGHKNHLHLDVSPWRIVDL